MSVLGTLRARGFDLSRHQPFTAYYQVKCSQCEAMVINGTATHETGCPNAKFECKGCNNLLAFRAYCEDCR